MSVEQTQHTQNIVKITEKVTTEYGVKVAVDIPYSAKNQFKQLLDWNATHRTWNSRHNCWTVDEDSVNYVVSQLRDNGFNVVNLIN